ncbi:MAPEG family protein [Camelimonas abortus]|uniref:MAPEG family protein n=1 Tax=Camelimonas abortus TaxID=1017184 RepID=A0ABV7LDM7_9HYPH
MSVQAVLLPVFALVLLTFALLFMLAAARRRALARGLVREADVAFNASAWPDDARRINDAYGNALAMPALFYVLVALALITRKADLVFVAMEWAYVAARAVQAAAHVRGLPMRIRGGAFGASVAILLLMWGIFAVRILFAA